MPSRPWYPFFPGDYLQDTIDLTLEEHGAYHLLLHEHWRRGYIPTDKHKLKTILRLRDTRSVDRLLPQLLPFLFEEDGRLYSARMLKEIEKTSELSTKRRISGKKGGEANAKQMLKQKGSKPQPQPQGSAHPKGARGSPCAEAEKEASKVKGAPAPSPTPPRLEAAASPPSPRASPAPRRNGDVSQPELTVVERLMCGQDVSALNNFALREACAELDVSPGETRLEIERQLMEAIREKRKMVS